MPSEPVPALFQTYFYCAIGLAVIVSLIAVFLYRREVRRNMGIRNPATGVLPVPESKAAHGPRVGAAIDYAVTERRLKIRLSLVYSAAIVGVVALAVWIRFFAGQTTLIRGSIMFLMWRGALGSPVASALSAALFAAIGIPLLAILVAWSWRRAAVVFVLYVAVWAADAFGVMTGLYGWSMANWASTLVLAQCSLIGLVALEPFLLLALTGNRRVRAVVPMTMAGSLVFCAMLVGATFLFPKPGHLISRLSAVVGLALAALLVCWGFLRVLARLYERKAYSDRQLLVDCWSLMIILYVFARLGETPGTPQLLIASAFLVFLVYRLFIQAALRLLIGSIQRPPNRRLLLLRAFGFQRRTERIFDAIGERWRFHGSVLMIAGTDLAARTISPDNYLSFLVRRLRSRFIGTEADLQRNLELLDDRPDPDGRYRINELFCDDGTWYQAVVALIDRADLVLMDLRGFGPNHRGCVFELQQSVERGPAGQVFLAVDDTTDRQLLDSLIQGAWNRLPEETRGDGTANPTVLPMNKRGRRAMDAVFEALEGANATSRERLPTGRRLREAIVVPGAIAALLLCSVLGVRGLHDGAKAGAAAAHTAPKSTDADEHYRLAIELDDKKDYEGAIGELRKAVATGQNAAEAHYMLGLELDKQGDRKAAIGEYRSAVKGKPDLAEAHYSLGEDLVHNGELEAAIAAFRQALDANPNLDRAHYDLGVILDQKGDHEAAFREYGKAVAVNPKLAEAHYNLGIHFENTGDHEAAVAEFRKAVAAKPDLGEAHLKLGIAMDGKGDREAAIGEYRKALSANPQLADAHYNLGVDFYNQGDSEAAVEEMRKALAVNPGLASAHYNIGHILDEKGDWDAAILEYRKAVAIQSDLTEARYNLGADLDRKGDHEAAIAEFRAVLAVKPDLAEAHNALAMALFAYGDAETAKAEFRIAFAHKSDYAEAHYNLGIVLYNKDDNEAAIKEYREALAIKPDLAEAHYNLAMALKDTGREEEAEQEFQEAQRLNPALKRQ